MDKTVYTTSGRREIEGGTTVVQVAPREWSKIERGDTDAILGAEVTEFTTGGVKMVPAGVAVRSKDWEALKVKAIMSRSRLGTNRLMRHRVAKELLGIAGLLVSAGPRWRRPNRDPRTNTR